jgi:phage-related minor tail protein
MGDNMAEYDSNIPDYEMMLMSLIAVNKSLSKQIEEVSNSLKELNRRLIELEKQHAKD